jgi:hypothetical protein
MLTTPIYFTSLIVKMEMLFDNLHHLVVFNVKRVFCQYIHNQLAESPIWALAFPDVGELIAKLTNTLRISHGATSSQV